MELQSELGLVKGFHSSAHEALLGIYYTAAQLKKRADAFFSQHDLTDVQFNVLMLVQFQGGEDGLTQVQLARMMLVNRANITALIDRMERQDLVRRVADPADRRHNLIKTTARAGALLAQAYEPYKEEVRAVMRVLDEEEVRALIGALERIRGHLGANEKRKVEP